MNELLSICIPTYKQDNLLRCLDNVVEKARLFSLQIFITDNSDNDNSKFIQQYKYKYIFYEWNGSNIGPDKNMMKVLSKCPTPFALWLGDDDYLLENTIESIILYLKNIPDIDLLILDYFPIESSMVVIDGGGYHIILNKRRDILTRLISI